MNGVCLPPAEYCAPTCYRTDWTGGCGKTDRLLERYRAVLSTATPGSTLWLAPTSRAAAEIRSHLLGGGLDACFAPGVNTFARFAETVLQRPQPLAFPG